MRAKIDPITITMRIPGAWSDPRELIERIPDDVQLDPDKLTMPDGTEYELFLVPPDQQFASIFRDSCRRPASKKEQSIVDRYQVNVCLSGPGGSMDAARNMMKAASVIIEAGAGGVFIDNSIIAHGGSDWLEMTEDAGSEAISFAFVNIVRSRHVVYTAGLHTLGFPEIEMQHKDVGPDGLEIIELIQFLCVQEMAFDNGELIGDEAKPQFQVSRVPPEKQVKKHPIYNPFGKIRLTSLRDIVDRN